MAMVITLDQRGSRDAPDRVELWAETLNAVYGDGLVRPFVRTAGDELQAVLRDPAALADIVARSVEDGNWWVGVGAGAIEHLGDTARDSQGPAFWHARQAVDSAKKQSTSQPVAVQGDPPDAAALADALTALAFIITRRTPEQRESVQLFRQGMKNKDIAAQLNVSPPAISQRLRSAGAREEAGVRRLISAIAARLVEA